MHSMRRKEKTKPVLVGCGWNTEKKKKEKKKKEEKHNNHHNE